MELNYNTDRFINYSLNFDQFIVLADSLAANFAQDGNQWYRLTKDEVRRSLMLALRHYLILNLHEKRLQAGIFDSAYLSAVEYASIFQVPRYFRDVFREISRVMVDGEDVYLPIIQFDDIGAANIFIAFNFDVNICQKFKASCERAKLDLVPLQIEKIRTVPVSVWDNVSNVVQLSGMIPEYREKAFVLIKHHVFREINILTGEEVIPSPTNINVGVALVNRNENEHTRSCTSGIIDLITGVINGRRSYVTVNMWLHPLPIILNGSRFPTDECHLRTPPWNSRSYEI